MSKGQWAMGNGQGVIGKLQTANGREWARSSKQSANGKRKDRTVEIMYREGIKCRNTPRRVLSGKRQMPSMLEHAAACSYEAAIAHCPSITSH